ncbi:hypothetical protein DEU56DRAFT_905176 [Suillus clintonianus]|uniref:uncharacterized protein n=1 Tax=Suillus clintonianus TaxID=1904413 RepID=UPI001B863813|nr:uncharacterized protein DEU56DRAFT_905176 [Suillus clintonianus]KAG2116398.1 hypothetical protein DEU56DRAFT_905176 [Suillus clintonianus]
MIKPNTPIWVEAYEISGNRPNEVKAGLVLPPANNRILINKVTPFFEIFKPVIQEWRCGILKAAENANETTYNFGAISHEEVESILNRWVSKFSKLKNSPLFRCIRRRHHRHQAKLVSDWASAKLKGHLPQSFDTLGQRGRACFVHANRLTLSQGLLDFIWTDIPGCGYRKRDLRY